MNTHVHPMSGAITEGYRLGPGARLRPDDRYDSTSGTWAECPCPGVGLESGCETVWVRPSALSDEARTLLGFLVTTQAFLYRPLGKYWRACWSRSPREGGQIDHPRVTHQKCAQELCDFGFVAHVGNEVFALTVAGLEYHQSSLH